MRDRRDVGFAVGVAGAAVAIYIATLAPGLIAITDTPKFQFVGRVLGTAHPPGYPLYVLVSHVFGYLPIGSLAYRINLMSAVFAAAACGLTFCCARLLGVGRAVAAVTVLGLAFGSAFWYVSTIAEVYALNACLVAAILLSLLAWQRSLRATWFYAAVALVGIAMGDHTTIVFMVPATALFACLVAPRFALRPRTIVTAALIVALCLTQYLFVILRTRQGAWSDGPASTLAELVRVVAGADYFRDVMPGGIRQFLHERIAIVWRAFVTEMSVAGVVLALLGGIALWRRSMPALVLLVVGVLQYALFAAAYMPHEFEVFLVPAFIMCWLLAAAGGQWLAELTRRRRPQWGAALAAGIIALVPTWQLARNYHGRDLSDNRGDMRFFDALFDQLPVGAALLHEDFLIDRMVYYKTLGERALEGRRGLALVPAEHAWLERVWRDRYQIFAFPRTARSMRLMDGAEFSYAPVALDGGPLSQYLDDLPRGTIVAIGVPALHRGTFSPDRRLPLGAIGLTKNLAGTSAESLAVIGTRGGRPAQIVSHPFIARATLEQSGTTAALPAIAVTADSATAAIEYGGREILSTRAGVAVAAWQPDGRLMAAFVAPAAGLSAPTLPVPYSVFALRALRERQPLDGVATNLTPATATANFVYRSSPGRSRFVLYAARARPLSPAVLECSARDWPAVDVKIFEAESARGGELSQALRADGVPENSRLAAMRYVYRIAIDTNWSLDAGTHIGLGGVPEIAFGRLLSGTSALIYGLDLSTHLARVDGNTSSLHMARDHHQDLVGSGWSSVQSDDVGGYRETIGDDAELLLPVAEPGPLRVGVQLLPLPGGDATTASVELRFNDQSLSSIVPQPAWRRYWWNVPAAAVKVGPNSLVVRVSPSRNRIAVSDVLIEH